MEGLTTSTPSLLNFDPCIIPYQHKVISAIRKEYDYSAGVQEILLSGSVGSAKSTLLSHLAVTHCLLYPGARFLIGRQSMPALRSTIFNKTLEHLGSDLQEGRDFTVNLTTASIRFRNGSEIISRSWADQKYFKVRSLELSAAAIEETSENQDQDFYTEIKMRVGRLPHIKENFIIHATNPSDPGHWLYKYFNISGSGQDKPSRHVFYSVTTDNPFLPPQYIEQLKQDLDPKMARRMLYGEWLEIAGEVIYYEYRTSEQFRRYDYKIDPAHPVILSWDFNIGEGKPISMICAQFINDEWHFFDEVVISGARTADTIDDLNGKGLLRPDWQYIICGDSSGKNKDTRSVKSDYEIIRASLDQLGIKYQYMVPIANPPIRSRHNRVNAYCRNAAGQTRLWVYQKAKTLDEGLRLVKLKPGAQYIEDDSKAYQHITTAAGYALHMLTTQLTRQPQRTIQL